MSSPVWFMHIMKRTGQWWTAEPHLRCVQTDNSIVQRNNLFSRCWASVGSWGSVLGDIPKCWPIKLVDIPGGLLTVDIEVNWCHHVNFWSVFSSGVRLNTPPFFFSLHHHLYLRMGLHEAFGNLNFQAFLDQMKTYHGSIQAYCSSHCGKGFWFGHPERNVWP